MIEEWLPLAMSLVGITAWVFAGGGYIDHWRRGWTMPLRSVVAAILAAVSASVAYLVASGIYLDPDWTAVSRPVANVQRAFLATTGIVALVSLARSAWRQRR